MVALNLPEVPVFIIIITGVLVIIAFIALPFWHRQFFDPGFVGLDAPHLVQWSQDKIIFKGAYFRIEITPEAVVRYRTLGLTKRESYFILFVRIRQCDGSFATMTLGQDIPKKEFLKYLKREK